MQCLVVWLALGDATCSMAAESSDGARRVEITGTATADDGRDSSASRVIVQREEIERYGDASVVDVLRRIPGITVSGAQGRASDIRMRGLGSGYTQILINGEPAPAGFSLDALPPSQIERIEVSRVAAVDLGAQAIAGTINIILRQSTRKVIREVKPSVGSRAGQRSYALDTLFSDRADGVSYSLGAGLSRKSDLWLSTITQQGSDATGAPNLDRVTERRTTGLAQGVSLTPKLTWQTSSQDRVGLDMVLRHTRFDDHSRNQRSVALGALPQYSSDDLQRDLHTTLAQTRLNWARTLDSGATLDLRLGSNLLWRDSDTRLLGRDEQEILVMDEHVSAKTTERGAITAGKLRLPYLEGHAAAVGWDGERTVRSDERSQRQTSPTGRATADLDESYRTTIERLAVYVQDEWDADDTLSVYAGIRWQTLGTDTQGVGITATGNRSAVASPVLQVLWKPVAAAGDRFRLALSRSYKAPRAVDLIPRRFVAVDNTPTTPDIRGNPDLRPELAWGVDLGYEHPLPSDAGLLSVNGSARRIQDVILDQLAFDNGAWVSTKANQGGASVFSLELDARWRWRTLWPAAPDAEWRANLTRNWSRVDQVPGPDNRLDSQIPLSALLAVDWRLDDAPLTVGASLALRGRMRTQLSATQAATSNAYRTLDLYALWKFKPSAQLRLAVANALHQTDLSTDTYADANGTLLQTTRAAAEPTIRLGLELKL